MAIRFPKQFKLLEREKTNPQIINLQYGEIKKKNGFIEVIILNKTELKVILHGGVYKTHLDFLVK